MKYKELEAKARRLSAKGYGLRMWQTKTEWHWEWAISGIPVLRGHTTAAVKPVAFVFALQSIS